MRQIVTAGNTLVPALLTLESLGFRVELDHDPRTGCRAVRGNEVYAGDDPVSALGLVKLVEVRGWNWAATDSDIEATLRRHSLDGER